MTRDDDFDAPDSVLVTGTWRMGRQQPNNLYVLDDDGSEYYVGALFRPHYGPAVVGRLNLARMAALPVGQCGQLLPTPDGDVVCLLNRGHATQHHGRLNGVGSWWNS
jgi:hypothetical protein